MQPWGEERTVPAAVLRHLLIGKDWPVDARGVRLRGIRISGRLDLQAATLHCPLHLDSCILDAQLVCLDQAAATVLTITGCHLAGLTGEALTAKTLDLSGSTLTGQLRLTTERSMRSKTARAEEVIRFSPWRYMETAGSAQPDATAGPPGPPAKRLFSAAYDRRALGQCHLA
jgi:hypothetical protein